MEYQYDIYNQGKTYIDVPKNLIGDSFYETIENICDDIVDCLLPLDELDECNYDNSQPITHNIIYIKSGNIEKCYDCDIFECGNHTIKELK